MKIKFFASTLISLMLFFSAYAEGYSHSVNAQSKPRFRQRVRQSFDNQIVLRHVTVCVMLELGDSITEDLDGYIYEKLNCKNIVESALARGISEESIDRAINIAVNGPPEMSEAKKLARDRFRKRVKESFQKIFSDDYKPNTEEDIDEPPVDDTDFIIAAN